MIKAKFTDNIAEINGRIVSDNEDECEFTVAINFCPKCGRKLSEA